VRQGRRRETGSGAGREEGGGNERAEEERGPYPFLQSSQHRHEDGSPGGTAVGGGRGKGRGRRRRWRGGTGRDRASTRRGPRIATLRGQGWIWAEPAPATPLLCATDVAVAAAAVFGRRLGGAIAGAGLPRGSCGRGNDLVAGKTTSSKVAGARGGDRPGQRKGWGEGGSEGGREGGDPSSSNGWSRSQWSVG
jgi:hypothetical protein